MRALSFAQFLVRIVAIGLLLTQRIGKGIAKNFIMLAVGAAVSFNVLAAEVFTVPTDTKASYTVLEKTVPVIWLR
jgi:hypothetical protein